MNEKIDILKKECEELKMWEYIHKQFVEDQHDYNPNADFEQEDVTGDRYYYLVGEDILKHIKKLRKQNQETVIDYLKTVNEVR